MDVAEFRSLILDDRLRLLFDYWLGLRGTRPMPDWGDIKAEEFGPTLPYAWVWITDGGGKLRLRIVGESVMQIMEQNLKGKSPFDLYPADQAKTIVERLTRMITQPSCSYAIGEVHSGDKLVGIGQRIGMPYYDRRAGHLGVIGASVIDKRLNSGAGYASAIYSLIDGETYLPLS